MVAKRVQESRRPRKDRKTLQKYFNIGQAGSNEFCALEEEKNLCLNLKFVLDAAFSILFTSEEDSRSK